jgi:polynucleotide 5'-kinase involved in rRNA processing
MFDNAIQLKRQMNSLLNSLKNTKLHNFPDFVYKDIKYLVKCYENHITDYELSEVSSNMCDQLNENEVSVVEYQELVNIFVSLIDQDSVVDIRDVDSYVDYYVEYLQFYTNIVIE